MNAKDFIIDFLSVFYEAMPFIVLGSLISGFLEELVPQQFFARFVPKNRFLAICSSALLGIVFPMCECGIMPVMRRLLRKGLPLSCCIAYMLCGPIVNVVVFLSTYYAFKGHWQKGGYYIIAMRMILGYVVAVCTALIVERVHRKYGNSLLTDLTRPDPAPLPTSDGVKTMALNVIEENGAPAKAPRAPVIKRAGNIAETALHDFMDITIFLTIGAVLAALTKQRISPAEIATYSNDYPPLAILTLMVLAILITLCSEADAFVAAAFTDLHPSAKLAFLVLGPMLDLKLIMLYTRVFRPRLIATIIVSVVTFTFVIMVILHYLWDPVFHWPSPLHPAAP